MTTVLAWRPPNRKDLINSILAAIVASIMIATATAAQAKAAPESFANLAQKLLPSVVNISTTQVIESRAGPELPQFPPGSPFEEFFKEFFDRRHPQHRSRRATSLGSGFVISDDGYVVTNNHVIQEAAEITVILQDTTRLTAELVGRDPKTDIAVLKVETDKKLSALEFGNSAKSRVGDWIVAIGNPFGLGGTVTAGIISARGRDIGAGPYDYFIQTDASINRGNSGGPMFNLDGKVIGINTAIYSPTGGSVGIGFAIPSSMADPVIRQLIKNGEVKRGWLGVRIQAVTKEIAESLGLDKPSGAMVASLMPNGPAEKAKVKAGDVILTFNGKKVPEMRALPRIVADTEVGKEVEIEIWRDNKNKTIRITIGELPESAEVASRTSGDEKEGARSINDLGLTVSSITDAVRERYKLGKEAKGVVVTEVDGKGPAAEKGVRSGDLILEVSQDEVSTPTQFVNKIKEAKKAGRKSVLLLLEGQSGLRFVAIRIEKT